MSYIPDNSYEKDRVRELISMGILDTEEEKNSIL